MENYSVLMSVYFKEQPEYLRQSMQSIFDQTVPTNDFVLVCDGGLTEELDAVIFEMQQKYPNILNVVRFEKNRGLGPSLNDGLKVCKNRLVARMDSDDFAPSYRCALQLKAFEQNQNLGIVGGTVEEFEKTPQNVISKKEMPVKHDEIIDFARRRSPFNHPTVMLDKDVALKLGGYPNFPLHEDYALWANLLKGGVVCQNLKETLCYMRVDSGLYSRRGGFGYLKTATKFRWHLYKIGFSEFFDVLCAVSVLTVACLIPSKIRRYIYIKVLRTK